METNSISKPVLMLSLHDFDVLPCNPYLLHILEKYQESAFNVYDVIGHFKLHSSHILWLLIHCPKSRTNDMFALYLSLGPSLDHLLFLIEFHNFAHRDDVLERILSLKPSSVQLYYLLLYHFIAFRENVLEAFLSNNPSSTLLSSLISLREFAHREDVFRAYLRSNPSDDEIIKLSNRCNYVKQMLYGNQ